MEHRAVGPCRVTVCCMAMALGAALAQAQDPPEKLAYTDIELDGRTPRWPNPILSFLPAGADIDWDYWNAKMRRDGRRRAAERYAAGRVLPEIMEEEPSGVRGWNDTHAQAEWIAGFGSRLMNEVGVSGELSAEAPLDLGFFSEETEDDGAIPMARPTGLTSGSRIRASAFIGDGLHGSNGGDTGDFDFYRIGALVPGQMVTVSIKTPEADSTRLDTKVGLYDSAGALVDQNDDGLRGAPDSFLQTRIGAASEYYVLVRGINSDWPGDPFDPASGPKAGSEGPYTIHIGIDAQDVDYFSFRLQPGDVLSATLEGDARRLTLYDAAAMELMGADVDWSHTYPPNTPLRLGGNANIAYVITKPGAYALSATWGAGLYSMGLGVYRPALEGRGAAQTLFIDFDGASFNAEALGGNPAAQLTGLGVFLDVRGLDEDAVIDGILATVRENLVQDVGQGVNPDFGLDLRNSRDDVDVWGEPLVSRVIVGGSQAELGLKTIGIAESVDVGNFELRETAVVLLDLLTDPDAEESPASVERAEDVTFVEALGVAIGNVVSHEAGHLFANFHTGRPDYDVSIMDGRPDPVAFIGAGADRIFGTEDDRDIDLDLTAFNEDEGFTGLEDTRNAIAFGLFGRGPLSVHGPKPSSAGLELGAVHPNPASARTRLMVNAPDPLDLRIALYDVLGRRVRTVYEGWVAAGMRPIELRVDGLPSGVYALRAESPAGAVTRSLVVAR